jgi:hypothetical protein
MTATITIPSRRISAGTAKMTTLAIWQSRRDKVVRRLVRRFGKFEG